MEKSKRVKAFRCGEFDDCISKAESFAGVPSKKREKYARREDAILHALELERQQLESKQQLRVENTDTTDKHQHITSKKTQNGVSVDYKEKNDQTSDNSKGILDATSLVDVSSGFICQQTLQDFDNRQLYFQKGRQGKESNNGDEGNEGIPRMRGLQDFGLKIASSRKKNSSTCIHENGEIGGSLDNCGCTTSTTDNAVSSNCNRGCSLSIKRKRTHLGHSEECSIRKRERRRPLMQVLQSSAKLALSSISKLESAKENAEQCMKERGEAIISAVKQMKRSSSSEASLDILDSMGTFKETHFSKDTIVKTENSLKTISFLANNVSSSFPESGNFNSNLRAGIGSSCGNEEAAIADSTLLFPATKKCDEDLTDAHPEQKFQEYECPDTNNLEDADFCSHYSTADSADQSTENVTDAGASKWQLKGRRNVRHLGKKSIENGNMKNEPDDTCATYMPLLLSEDNLKVDKELMSGNAIWDTRGSEDLHEPEADIIEKGLPNRSASEKHRRIENSLLRRKREMQVPENQEFSEHQGFAETGIPRFSSENPNSSSLWKVKHESDWGWNKVANEYPFNAYHDASSSKVSKSLDELHFKQPNFLTSKSFKEPDSTTITSKLVDVDIAVQASYQGEHVPLVSLMSKLNNKAIVGHPVTVETLEDGSANAMFPESGYLDDSLVDVKPYYVDEFEGGALQPVWKTARRTAMQRTRRSCHLLESEDCGPSESLNYDSRQTFGSSSNRGFVNHKIEHYRRNHSYRRHSNLGKKLPKKILKKAGLSSQKTRRLSSLAVEHSRGNDRSQFSYPLKMPDIPIVSCIPVKLVFSRIKEAVGSTSKISNHSSQA
eukprot:TRINITY_DN20850_c0_g1_i2.p1 TRINITY_DN20850_c0_g1~~TRINITY_DN20850_c0_g1_i2.p1  ORF type:complete len:857 (+),score=208.05 TRINITY_DN20850_c0_g1_i2:65-2572(+)